jgi:hypothetical protein
MPLQFRGKVIVHKSNRPSVLALPRPANRQNATGGKGSWRLDTMVLAIAVGAALLIALVTGASRSVGHNFWSNDKIEQEDKTEQADKKSPNDKSDQKDQSGQVNNKSSKKSSEKRDH